MSKRAVNHFEINKKNQLAQGISKKPVQWLDMRINTIKQKWEQTDEFIGKSGYDATEAEPVNEN